MDDKNSNDLKKGKRMLISMALAVGAVCWLYLGSTPAKTENTEKQPEVSAEEEQVSEETEKLQYFTPAAEQNSVLSVRHKIDTESGYSVLTIDGVCYLVYESGYGAAHSVAVTPMYNADGTIKTEEEK